MRRALLFLVVFVPAVWLAAHHVRTPVAPSEPSAAVDADLSPSLEPIVDPSSPPGDRAPGAGASETGGAGEKKPAAAARRSALLALLREGDKSPHRRRAVAELRPMAARDAEVRQALVTAAADPDPKVRAAAVSALGGIAGLRTDARDAVLRALGDPDRQVRETAVMFLGNLGEAGGRRALEALFEQEWSGDALDDLCSHVAEFALVPDALERKPSAAAMALLLRHLCFETSGGHPEYARALRGHYSRLVNDFVPDHNYGWREFFETAEMGGDGYLIRDRALDAESPDAVRLGALGATIRREDGGRSFFDLIDRILSGTACPEEMRLGLIEHLDTMRVAHPEHRAKVRGILREFASADPSKRVRESARAQASF